MKCKVMRRLRARYVWYWRYYGPHRELVVLDQHLERTDVFKTADEFLVAHFIRELRFFSLWFYYRRCQQRDWVRLEQWKHKQGIF